MIKQGLRFLALCVLVCTGLLLVGYVWTGSFFGGSSSTSEEVEQLKDEIEQLRLQGEKKQITKELKKEDKSIDIGKLKDELDDIKDALEDQIDICFNSNKAAIERKSFQGVVYKNDIYYFINFSFEDIDIKGKKIFCPDKNGCLTVNDKSRNEFEALAPLDKYLIDKYLRKMKVLDDLTK